MFLQNRYTVIYYAIIAQARSSPRKKKTGTYYENHHIIPRSIGGTNSKDNLVLLTAKEHYVCHRLLLKMVEGGARSKMYAALTFLQGRHKASEYPAYSARKYESDRKRCVVTGRDHHLYGKPVSEKRIQRMKSLVGEKALFYGRKHTEETKQAMSLAKKGKNVGSLNHMFGKTHSEAVKNKLSKLNTGSANPFFGKKHSDEFLSRNRGETHAMFGKKHSEETRAKIKAAVAGKQTGENNHRFGVKLSEAEIAHRRALMTGRRWINDGHQQRLLVKDSALPDGWVYGRIR